MRIRANSFLGFALTALVFAFSANSAHALTTSAHSLRIEDKREGNVLLGAENAVIDRGEIFHTIVVVWGKLEIYGQVDEVVVLSGQVVFHEGSKLTKSLVVMGGSFESKPGAQVASENVMVKAPGPLWRMLLSAGNVWRENFDWVARLVASFSACLLLWLLGWAVFGIFPGLQKKTEGDLSKFWGKNLVVGILGSFFAPVLGVMLVVSILGILLLPFYILLLLLAGLLSYIAAGLWTGHRLLPPRKGERIRPMGFLLGLLILQFLWVVPVWWAWLPVFLIWTLSWGALLRSLRRIW